MKNDFPGFDASLQMMRKHDAQKQEDAFHWLLPHAYEYVEPLMKAFAQEKDHGLKCWLLELIGEAKSPETLPLLVDCLRGSDAALRTWAIRGLKHLDSKVARSALHEAEAHTV